MSIKGQLAYRVLTEFPDGQPRTVDKRIYKAWIILTVTSVILLILYGYFLSIPVERISLALAILLLATAFAFYVRVRPSTSGNRVFFVAVSGGVLGFIIWVAIFWLFNVPSLRWHIIRSSGDLAFDAILASALIICWVIGGYVGDWLGRRRDYAIPLLRV